MKEMEVWGVTTESTEGHGAGKEKETTEYTESTEHKKIMEDLEHRETTESTEGHGAGKEKETTEHTESTE